MQVASPSISENLPSTSTFQTVEPPGTSSPRDAARQSLASSRTDQSARRGALALNDITVRFDAQTIVDRVTITAAPGEFVVVVGPSGCGKSTLLNVAAGMVRPSSGGAMIDGRDVTGPGPDRAMVFQEHTLFPWLTAAQNVEFGMKMACVPKSERRDRAHAALEMVHLARSGTKLIHQLSGGLRQRVAIARALVLDPAVLLMDEPFAALDAQTRSLMHLQLQELWIRTRKTVLFVTHSVNEAVRLADRIFVLHTHPGRVRKQIDVRLAHPRDFDSNDVSAIARRVRREIEDEVTRVNAEQARRDADERGAAHHAADEAHWRPAPSDDLVPAPGDVGGFI
jgi:NitT/TauT family transport system ATP-binding protein